MDTSGIIGALRNSRRTLAVSAVCLALAFAQPGLAQGAVGSAPEIIHSTVRVPAFAAIVPGTVPVEFASLVNTIETSAWSPPAIDPAGIAYISHKGRLLISDSEVDEEPTLFEEANLFQVSTTGVLDATGLSPDAPREPTGLSYDPASRRLFVSNDVTDRIYIVDAGADDLYGTADDAVSSFDMSGFGLTDLEDVAFDTSTGALFLADGVGEEVFRIAAGPNGVFEGDSAGTDDVVTSFDISTTEIDDAEGLAYRPVSDTLLVLDAGNGESIFELTKAGQVLRRIDLDVIHLGGGIPETPADLVLAPASDGSGQEHIYVVDRKRDNGTEDPPPRDGKLYELTAPFADLAPFVDAGSDASVTLSAGASLTGEAYDDGQPTIGALTTSWSKVSGPGTVNFANASNTSTTATFSATGTYVLELKADDTTSSTVDTVQITVIADPIDNTAPVVDAGSNQSVIRSNGAALGASVTDDGKPDPPGALTSKWMKVSGPGSVTFANAASLTTTVAFSTPGTYTLRLTVDDSQLSGSDEVVINVSPDPVVIDECIDEDYTGHPFTDLGGLSQEVNDAVDCLGLYGVANGTTPTTFSPFDDVARWQMALFLTRLVRAEGVPLPNGTDQGFIDISEYPASAQTAINQLAQLGITQGTGPGTFAPGQSVPRWQMALFLSRLLDEVGATLPSGSPQGYTDIASLPTATQTAINQITQLGVAKGTSSTTFSPTEIVSRWQMALFLDRSLHLGGLP